MNNEKKDNTETITGMQANQEAILIYLIPILGFVFSLLKDRKVSKEAKFHYNQAATSFIITLAASIISFAPIIGWIIVTAIPIYDIVMRIIALIKAQSNELYEIPLEYELTKKIWHTEK